MKPVRNPKYLTWIRTQPCLVCGSTRWIEAAHTGPHGLGQKSPDSSAVPLCATHHRTGKDSYHRLGPRKFNEIHSLDLAAIVRRLNLKPIVRIQNGEFVAYLEGCRYRLGETPGGIASALRTLRSVCGADRLALEITQSDVDSPSTVQNQNLDAPGKGSTSDQSRTMLGRSVKRTLMSYSFHEPEWPAFCECKYDETRDEMDREDCPFHCCMSNDAAEEQLLAARKRQAGIESAKGVRLKCRASG